MVAISVLVVEDDPDIQELLLYALTKELYEVIQAYDATSAIKIVAEKKVDIILLDIMLPDISGLDLLKKLNNKNLIQDTPVLIMSAKGEESDIVLGLELGADDYITKPFSPRILVARIRTALRRKENIKKSIDNKIEIKTPLGLFTLNKDRYEVLLNDENVVLSATEFSILEKLARSSGRVFTRSQIIDEVKGHDYPVTDRSIDVQILSIRKKLKNFSVLIETIRGVGYRFKDE